jgi:hemerythrin-like domain-containing protein
MLTIGKQGGGDEPADALAACHERIRRFLEIAARLATDEAADDDDVATAAAAVRRYFAEALPLHERDEDDTVAPRLAGRDPALDRAVAAMTAEHGELRPWTARLIELATELAGAPGRRATLRPDLAAVLAELAPRFAAHLAAEEAAVLPAVAALPAADRAAVRAEMRARRDADPRAAGPTGASTA